MAIRPDMLTVGDKVVITKPAYNVDQFRWERSGYVVGRTYEVRSISFTGYNGRPTAVLIGGGLGTVYNFYIDELERPYTYTVEEWTID